MNSISLSLFLALPAPLKIAAIVIGGVFFTGMKVERAAVEKVEIQAAEAARDEAKARPMPVNPAAKRAPAQKAVKALAPLEFSVNSDGSYQLAGKKLSAVEMTKVLKSVAAKSPLRRVVIKANATIPHQMVVNAMKLSKGAGLTNVSFASAPAAP